MKQKLKIVRNVSLSAVVDVEGANHEELNARANALKRALQMRGAKALPSTAKWEMLSQNVEVSFIDEEIEPTAAVETVASKLED